MTFMGSLSGGVFWAAMFFVTAEHYRFSPERNLMLAAVMGAVYAVAAAGAGRLVRRLSSLSSPRAVLVAALAAWTMAALIPLARAACRGGDLGGGGARRGGVGRHLADRRELPERRTTRRARCVPRSAGST